MLYKRNKLVITLTLIAFLAGGICYNKLKSYSKIIYPSRSIHVANTLYFINIKDGFLYKTNINSKVECRVLKDKIDSLGIIIFKNKLYYINSTTKKLCYIELNGKNIKEVETCNIIMPFQPLFRLGVHIYYYNNENKLIRIDDSGVREEIAKVMYELLG